MSTSVRPNFHYQFNDQVPLGEGTYACPGRGESASDFYALWGWQS